MNLCKVKSQFESINFFVRGFVSRITANYESKSYSYLEISFISIVQLTVFEYNVRKRVLAGNSNQVMGAMIVILLGSLYFYEVNSRHLKSTRIILAFSAQHEAYLSCIIAAFFRPTIGGRLPPDWHCKLQLKFQEIITLLFFGVLL